MENGGSPGRERSEQKSYWTEHTAEATVEAMMLDSQASVIDKEERPEVKPSRLRIPLYCDPQPLFEGVNDIRGLKKSQRQYVAHPRLCCRCWRFVPTGNCNSFFPGSRESIVILLPLGL